LRNFLKLMKIVAKSKEFKVGLIDKKPVGSPSRKKTCPIKSVGVKPSVPNLIFNIFTRSVTAGALILRFGQ